jgi:multidrug efflux pump subunit AcrB/ABC-type multidrug transport system ATPase subunit
MLFTALSILGLIAWSRVPVEMFPDVTGSTLYVNFSRPASETEVVERELLVPLENRVSELAEVKETWGELRGSTGSLRVRFEPGADLKVREIELQRIAAELAQQQPVGTVVDVSAFDLSAMSRFVMIVEVTGGADTVALRDFAEERIAPRLEATPGASRVWAAGGAPREITVRVDPDRAAALGVPVTAIGQALRRSVRRLEYLGGVEGETGRLAVVLDGRPEGLVTLGRVRIDQARPVQIRHVGSVEMSTGRQDVLYRVDGKPSIALVAFKDEDANLLRVGRELRRRVAEVDAEVAPFGLDLNVSVDGSELLQDQIDRLQRMGLTGFGIALLVLLLFLRQVRAVLVVGIAVPVSLLLALALLMLTGQTLNVITLFGLAVAIGMLVDNSIVVYEAVQRQLERGATSDGAAIAGIRRTVRAIFAATVTNAIVFLPILYVDVSDAALRTLLAILALAIVLPLVASLVVAVGLVPLLARHLAAPAALARIARDRRWRSECAGLLPPDRGRELFTGALVVALRRPSVWLVATTAAVLLTVFVALPSVLVTTAAREAPQADEIRMNVELAPGTTLERAAAIFDRLEEPLRDIEGVDSVVSLIREESGTLTVRLVDLEERPTELSAELIRGRVREAAGQLSGMVVGVSSESASGDGEEGDPLALLGGGQARVVVSGPDAARLRAVATEIRDRLVSIDEIASASISGSAAQEEIWVVPRDTALEAYGVTADQVLPVLGAVPREGVVMQTGITMADGREIPLAVRRTEEKRGLEALTELRVVTAAGVQPLPALANVTRMPSQPTIRHHDGRRELTVSYRLAASAPTVGAARQELDERIRAAIAAAHRPAGYTIGSESGEEATAWFRQVVVPVVLLLYGVLAVAFESLLLPLLVLLALPLTLIGAVWALLLAGMPVDAMAAVGVVALLGLTVNPAILLVDRMQQRYRGGMSGGAAALAAVRERARPVLMTTATTVAGLWPLALTTGRDLEIWPPFATVVMGGLGASTLLTLLVVPVGFVLIRRLEDTFGSLGPWVVIGWAVGTAAVVSPLFVAGAITSLTWRLITTLLVAAALLGLAVLALRKPEIVLPDASGGPLAVSVRFLHKVYGQPGPIGHAWRLPQLYARRVRARGGAPFDRRRAARSALPLAFALAGATLLATSLSTTFWQLIWTFVAAGVAAEICSLVRRVRGRVDELGNALPGGIESLCRLAAPWLALAVISWRHTIAPQRADDSPEVVWWVLVVIGTLLLVGQLGRRTARRIGRGEIREGVADGRLRGPRRVWRQVSRRVFGLDLPREEVVALSGVEFEVEGGMVGILGPNGAGKTTLLRQLAGILDPSRGAIRVGGAPLPPLRRRLARWIGYLPQDFGLPAKLSAREYLEYYSLLYRVEVREGARDRVQRLLDEVGLTDRADDPIGSYSGGMRQRVAVARTLLRLPPLIIVDEPTVGLDPRERIRFRNLLTRLSRGRTVLFSTHVVEDVAAACERVLVLAEGSIVYDGAPLELARLAEGRVWQLRAPELPEVVLAEGARIIDRVPEADGTLRMRIMSERAPHAGAQPLAPTLEDGYLLLLQRAREGAQ